MSTFAVFGMTHHFAWEEAKKKGCGSEPEILYYVDELFDLKRKARVSPMFDSPKMALHCKNIIEKTEPRFRDLSIRAQIRIKNPEGAKRAYKVSWVDDWQNIDKYSGEG